MLVTQDLRCVVTRVLYITLEINVMFTGGIEVCYVRTIKGIITRILLSVPSRPVEHTRVLFINLFRNRSSNVRPMFVSVYRLLLLPMSLRVNKISDRS